MDEFSDNVSDQSSEIPMTAESEAEYEYQALGKSIKEPISMILKRASQGYDYSQKMQDYNSKMNEFSAKYKTYDEIDRYAQENPEWWNHVTTSFSQRSIPNQSQEFNQAHDSTLNDPRLDKFESFMNEFMMEKKNKEREEADRRLNEEIDNVKKQYSTIDFNQYDDQGKSLEKKVLEYAVENGIKSFKTAFRDFYHDELVKRASIDGKSAAAKEVQRNTKMGLLGRTEAPTKGISMANNVRTKSYSDLTQEALNELGIN
jgi:hypothetical protein